MKKILIPMALALSLGLSIPAEVSAQSVSIADQTTSIHVTGHSRIEVEPDIAYLSVQFTVSDKKDAAHARGTLEKKFSAVIAKLKELGFTDEQLIAESLYTSKQYDYDVKPPKIIQYNAMRCLNVKIEDLKKLDLVIETVLGNESDAEIRNISFDVRDKVKYADIAKSRAIEDSISQARKLAAGYNAKVKKVLKVDYRQSYELIEAVHADIRSNSLMMNKARGVANDGGDAYYKPGKIVLSDEVDATFEIESGEIK